MTLPVDLPPTGTIVLVGLGLILLGLVLSRVGQALGIILLILGLMALLGLLAVTLFHQSRATAAAATAATVATTGQAVNSVAVTALTVLLVVVVFAGGASVLYLLYRLRRAEKRGQWLPGPNARWGRAGEMPPAPWWVYPPLPPVWWGYPPPMRGYGREPEGIYVIDNEDEGPNLEALPWEEEWGW